MTRKRYQKAWFPVNKCGSAWLDWSGSYKIDVEEKITVNNFNLGMSRNLTVQQFYLVPVKKKSKKSA